MKFLKDESGFGNIVYGAVGLVVFIILITSIVMPTILGADTAGTTNAVCRNVGPPVSYNASCAWGPANIALWGIIPIVVIASVILYVIGKK